MMSLILVFMINCPNTIIKRRLGKAMDIHTSMKDDALEEYIFEVTFYLIIR